jgi:pimeloyl-ACP methyl ester carboxylesterase
MSKDARSGEFQYKKVVLVAHSMGAIICRQALLRANASRDTWGDLVQLVLFAPAHLGATDIAGFASAVAEVAKAKFIVSVAELKWPVLKELQQESDTLKKLSNRTKKAIVGGKAQYLRAKKVVFGELDKVVIVDEFCSDEPYDVFEGKGHRDVCKPKASFRDPLDAVLEFL